MQRVNKLAKIRFKKYDNSLERRIIGDITTSFSGGTPKSSNKTYYEGNIPFIRSGEVKLKQTELFISDEALKNSSAKMVEKGDILYALYGATSGEVAISQINGAINQAILAIKPNPGYSSDFIMNYLKKEKDNILEKYLQGGQGNLSAAIVKSIELSLPSQDEQSAIGSLFRSLDDLLASYKDNLANYQSLKATMLSKMFPKVGQTVPEIRLDGFEGEWVEKRLKDVSKRVTRKNNDLVSERALTISAQFGLIDQEEFFQKKIASKDVSGYYLIKKGEFAYNKSYSTGYPLGAIKRLDKYENGVLSTLYILFKAVDVDSDYLAHYYESDKWHREVSMCAAEGARNRGLLNIAPVDFFNTRLVIPKEIEEQQAIGVYFSNLDQLITSYQEKITQLETLKKKLLQDMFI